MATRMTCGSGRAPLSLGLRSGLVGLTVFAFPVITEISMITTIARIPPTTPSTMTVTDEPDASGAGVEGGVGVVVMAVVLMAVVLMVVVLMVVVLVACSGVVVVGPVVVVGISVVVLVSVVEIVVDWAAVVVAGWTVELVVG